MNVWSDKITSCCWIKTANSLFSRKLLIGQSIVGAYTVGEGGCVIVDGVICSVPGISLCYYGGGAYQIIGGSCLIVSSVTGAICTPAGWTVTGIGYGFRKVGNYIIDNTNLVNPVLSVTKIV